MIPLFRIPLFRGGLLALAAVLTLTGCANGPTSATNSSDSRIDVVASTSVYGDIAAVVGGDRVNVTSIINNPNADPLEYESTPADAAAVASAQVVIVNGGGYDPFMPRLIEAAGGQRTVLVGTEISGLQSASPDGEEFNEHVWFSLPAMQELVDQIASALSATSPDDTAAFTANAEAFNAQVDRLRADVERIKSQHQGARVAATEPLPLYLLADAGLDNVTPAGFMEATEEGSDAPAVIIQQTLELFESDPVRVLVLNTQTQTPATDRVQEAARNAGVPVVEMNETLPDGSPGYVTWMRDQIDALAAALDQAR